MVQTPQLCWEFSSQEFPAMQGASTTMNTLSVVGPILFQPALKPSSGEVTENQGVEDQVVPSPNPAVGKGPQPSKSEKSYNFANTILREGGELYISEGFQFGLRIPFQGPRLPIWPTICVLFMGWRKLLGKKTDKERSKGRVRGAMFLPPVPNLQVSPLGIVPKKVPGEHHLICRQLLHLPWYKQ